MAWRLAPPASAHPRSPTSGKPPGPLHFPIDVPRNGLAVNATDRETPTLPTVGRPPRPRAPPDFYVRLSHRLRAAKSPRVCLAPAFVPRAGGIAPALVNNPHSYWLRPWHAICVSTFRRQSAMAVPPVVIAALHALK